MKLKIGKKMLLLLTLILAVVCTSVGVVTAEETGTIEEIKLISDSEVVALTTKTITDATTPGDTAAPAPIIQKRIGEDWFSMSATELTWTSNASWAAPVRSDGVVPYAGDWKMEKVTITGTHAATGLTVSYTVYPSLAIATKADLDALATKTGKTAGDGNAWYKSRCYALACDIDYAEGGAQWHERYMKPIASNTLDNEFQSGLVAGIWGHTNNVNGNIHMTRFGARLEGQGYSIKNAIIPLGNAFYKDSLQVYGGVWNNWIGRLWGGTVKDIKFENLTFESAHQAAANPYMYTVANNTALQGKFADANNDGTCDKTGLPVINDGNGNVTQIDVAKMYKENTNGLKDKLTISHRSGLIGKLACGLVENIYLDVNTNAMNGHYDSVSREKASGLVVACLQSNGSYEESKYTENGQTKYHMARNTAQIKDVIVAPTLTDGTANGEFLHAAYTVRTFGAIVGVAKVSGSVAFESDTIYNCAVLLEADSNLAKSQIKVYPTWNSAVAAEDHAETYTNTKVFKGDGTSSALAKLKDDSNEDAVDTTVFAKHGYWRMADVVTSVFQGEYGTAPVGNVNYATIVFGQLDLDLAGLNEISEYGVEIRRYVMLGNGQGNTNRYQLPFNVSGKSLTSDNRFAVALYDLPMDDVAVSTDDYKAYVYVKFADGSTIYSTECANFVVRQ